MSVLVFFKFTERLIINGEWLSTIVVVVIIRFVILTCWAFLIYLKIFQTKQCFSLFQSSSKFFVTYHQLLQIHQNRHCSAQIPSFQADWYPEPVLKQDLGSFVVPVQGHWKDKTVKRKEQFLEKFHTIQARIQDDSKINQKYLISCSSFVVAVVPLFISDPIRDGLIDGHKGSIANEFFLDF